MPRLILLLAIAAVLYLLFQRARNVPPHRRRSEFIKLGLIVAVVLVVGLTLTGRMHWIGAALTGLLVGLRQLLPTLIRFFPMLASLRAKSANQQQQQSTVDSTCLRMHLDHATGRLSGEVLTGDYKGWYLDEMNRTQLSELMDYCQREDADSADLLQSYMEQRFPGEDHDTGGAKEQDTGAGESGNMTRREALSILGLKEDADEQAIITAHRTLMQKLHPDRGGSDYLAAKINEAKDFLLG